MPDGPKSHTVSLNQWVFTRGWRDLGRRENRRKPENPWRLGKTGEASARAISRDLQSLTYFSFLENREEESGFH